MEGFSDHQPYFLCLNNLNAHNKYNKNTCTAQIRLTTENVEKFKDELLSNNTMDKLDKRTNANPNLNYNVLMLTIENAKEKHLLTKLANNFNKYKHKKCSLHGLPQVY